MLFHRLLLAKSPRIGYAIMVNTCLRGVFSLTQTLATVLQCAILAMMPVVELRGALPWAITRGLDPWFSFVLCVLFNMVPVPFILLFLNKILAWMETTRRLSGIAKWLKDRAHKKSETYYKYEMLGLFLLVAVPLPGTGAWTGALVASVFGLKMKRAIPPIFLGVAAAGVIMLTISLGAVSVFG